MAQRVIEYIVGVDVSKNTLDVFEWESNRSYSIPNEREAIEHWLAQGAVPMRLAIEPTNRYHQVLAEAAYVRGHEVWLINPYRLAHYREGVGQRVKADRQDARLLARYLSREEGEMRLWQPLSDSERRFWHLLKRRAMLVRARTQLQQSLTDLGSLQEDVDALLTHFNQTIRHMERALRAEAKRLVGRRRCVAVRRFLASVRSPPWR